jgi:hypothetical protein
MTEEIRQAIIAAIKDKESVNYIKQKYKIRDQPLIKIRDSIYPRNGYKVYPVGQNETVDHRKWNNANNLGVVKNTINSLKAGDTIRVVQKTYYDRESKLRLSEAEVAQVTQSAIYAKFNGRIECITIADLASQDVQITKVVGIDNPPQYVLERRERISNLFL